jgi:hypothetical protein
VPKERQPRAKIENPMIPGVFGARELPPRDHAGAGEQHVSFDTEGLVAKVEHFDARAAERAVDAAVADTRQEIVVVNEREVDRALRSHRFEKRQHGHDPSEPELVGRAQRQVERRRGVDFRRLDAFSDLVEGALHAREKEPALGRERGASRAAAEERISHVLFQVPDALTERGRRNADRGRGVSKAERFRGPFEILQGDEAG